MKKLTYERTLHIHKEYLKKTEDGQLQQLDVLIRELSIRNELMKHDFTKRQLNILIFIANHSFPFFKEEALIPKISDFEIAGISRNKLPGEIKKLEEMNVVTWNREENLFKINDPDHWINVPFNDGYSENRAKELFILNLKHANVGMDSISDN